MCTFLLCLMRIDSEVATITFDLWCKNSPERKLEKHLLFSWQPIAWKNCGIVLPAFGFHGQIYLLK